MTTRNDTTRNGAPTMHYRNADGTAWNPMDDRTPAEDTWAGTDVDELIELSEDETAPQALRDGADSELMSRLRRPDVSSADKGRINRWLRNA